MLFYCISYNHIPTYFPVSLWKTRSTCAVVRKTASPLLSLRHHWYMLLIIKNQKFIVSSELRRAPGYECFGSFDANIGKVFGGSPCEGLIFMQTRMLVASKLTESDLLKKSLKMIV